MEQVRLIGYKVEVRDSGIIVVDLGVKFKQGEIKDFEKMANDRIEMVVAKKMMIEQVDKIAGAVTFLDNCGLMTLEARVRMS